MDKKIIQKEDTPIRETQGYLQEEIISPDALKNQKREYLNLAKKFHVSINAVIEHYDILSKLGK